MRPIWRYSVVFCDPPVRRWWGWFLKPGFRHVLVFAMVGSEWVSLDPTAGAVLMHRVTAAEKKQAIGLLNGTEVIVHASERRAGGRLFAPLTCATMVAHVLGIAPWRALTPAQLHRHLVRRG